MSGTKLLNEPVDVSEYFRKKENIYFHMSRIVQWDGQIRQGSVEWQRYGYKVRTSFNQVNMPFEKMDSWEFPPEYEQNKTLPFDISFVSENVVRIRFSGMTELNDLSTPSLMIEKLEHGQWAAIEGEDHAEYKSSYGSLTVSYNPLRITLRDRSGKVLTRTRQIGDFTGFVNSEPIPTSIARDSHDLKRYMALTLSLSPGEAIAGGGESFTNINKRGQKLNLWTHDPKGVMNSEMYKPVPFFMSSKGYGLFVHTSAPVTLDIGQSYHAAQTVYVGDDQMDLFFFLGNPHEILGSYTRLTGRSPVPPLWSFGLWMSRMSYNSQEEVLDVAEKLRENRIPCDVIHLDSGWFDKNWRCNFEFSPERFPDPQSMIAKLNENKFHLSLWQLPYFTPKNELYREAVAKGYVVKDADGKLPTEDAIIDLSQPEAVRWYQTLLTKLYDLGVSAIKADFGEGAPLHGAYASGKSGRLEHNLYPLRYTHAIYEAARKQGQDSPVLWARSAWAGGQKYPVHWGGDPETTDDGMASTVRGGLSIGASGFTFWSHDNGGFISPSGEELYLRWLAFGMFTSHTRSHGQPPKEPWHFSEEFMSLFREIVNTRYILMPYIYAQSVSAAERGLPMLRALFIDFPDDPLAWGIEDEYLFGDSLLIAPLLHSGEIDRNVYLPNGKWMDYQTHQAYEGGRCYKIKAGRIPIVILVKDGSAIPQVPVAQSTQEIIWKELKFIAFMVDAKTATGLACIPGSMPQRYTFDAMLQADNRVQVDFIR